VQRRVSEYRERKAKGEVGGGADAIVQLNHIRQANSLAKVPAAVELAQESLEQEQPIILFTEFVESAKELNRQLGGELLTGSTSTEERQAMVDRFQSGKSKVFVSTIRAGGVGITLTAASQVVMVDRPWTPGDAEQAEDRAYRIGQKNMVNVHWLEQGEVDEAIDALLEKKQKAIDIVLRGKRKTMRGIASPEELAKQLLETL
jgi:SNF2 family DNA or RNA helicase